MKPAPLFPSVLRLLPLLWMAGCGGFTTPAQDVWVGLALTSTRLPPRLEQDGHVLVLSRLKLTGTAFVRGKESATQEPLAAIATDAALTTPWTKVAEGPLARGSYQRLRVELTSLSLDGSWDDSPFHLTAAQPKSHDFEFATDWRVELGNASSQSLVCDPLRWMTVASDSGQKLELIDPASDKAAPELMDRFFQSLTAARDDNHDGLADVEQP